MSRRHTDHFDTVTLQHYTDAQIAFIASVEHDYDDDPTLATIVADHAEHFLTDDEFDEEVVALARHFGVTPAAVECEWRSADEAIFTVDGEEWLVLDDADADAAARVRLTDSIWAFNSGFLYEHMPPNIPIEAVRALQDLCEDGSDALATMLGEDGLVDLLDDAIETDGRGHALAGWDGEEVEMPLALPNGRTVMYYGYRLS